MVTKYKTFAIKLIILLSIISLASNCSKDFRGWIWSSSCSINAGISVGLGTSNYIDESRDILFGLTQNIGIGVGPTILSGFIGKSFTRIYTSNQIYKNNP